jgi:hypothetical protein
MNEPYDKSASEIGHVNEPFGLVMTNMQAYMSVESVTNENQTRESFLNGRLSTR